MSLAGNVLWWVTGGFLLGLIWLAAGIVMALTIVGLPWAKACFELGKLCLAPFGKDVVSTKEMRAARLNIRGEDGNGGKPVMGALSFVAALIWFVPGAILACAHIVHGIILFCTIIGIPFAIQDFKIAGLSLFPVGKRVVNSAMADEVRRASARQSLAA